MARSISPCLSTFKSFIFIQFFAGAHKDWHRVLKSGCRIEDMAHDTAERLRRAIAINLVIAWRIMLMTLLGREVPDLPADVLFSDVELRTLHTYAKKN